MDTEQLCFLGGFPGDGLSELFGIVSEEIDTYYPSDRNHIRLEDGSLWEVVDYAEVLRVKDAKVLAEYTEDYYAGTAALTCKEYGRGKAYYMAARVKPEEMMPLFEKMLADAQIPVKKLPEGVELHVRTGEEGAYAFYLNGSPETVEIADVEGVDMLTGAGIQGTLTLPGYGVAVLALAKQ